MSFEQHEASRDRGSPVSLYFFRYGPATSVVGYTDAEQPISFDAGDGAGEITYEPVPIQHGEIVASGGLDKAGFGVRMPHDIALAGRLLGYPPDRVVNLVIRQGHIEDVDRQFLAVWIGRVLGTSREGSEVILQCEPISTSMRRPGLRRHYQYGCPHALYGPHCKADEEAATVTVEVVGIDGTTLQFNSDWNAAGPRKYVGGTVKWSADGNPEIRTILSATANSVTMAGPPRGLEVGNTVDVALGCNHQMTDCLNLHDNIQNYGGQPWIPTKNPIGSVSPFI